MGSRIFIFVVAMAENTFRRFIQNYWNEEHNAHMQSHFNAHVDLQISLFSYLEKVKDRASGDDLFQSTCRLLVNCYKNPETKKLALQYIPSYLDLYFQSNPFQGKTVRDGCTNFLPTLYNLEA